jgi:ABC-type dipeptide/oligopeptide/nickel transport system ATPase subunit
MAKKTNPNTRITQIDLQNFRAFRHNHSISLDATGKNLILYGENGSGKSSLFTALKQFLLSSLSGESIQPHRNLFTPQEETTLRFHIKNVEDSDTSATPYEWSTIFPVAHPHNQPLIQESAKSSGFLDYKDLLETHFLSSINGQVNIFPILVNTLLADIRNESTGKTFLEDWKEIEDNFSRKKTQAQVARLTKLVDNFNTGIENKLKELSAKIIDIFGCFGYYDVTLSFDFRGVVYNAFSRTLERQEVLLKVKFYNQDISAHYQFLNEAKLSAIGLSIYLSALLLNPAKRGDRFRILVLDDVLIGLDMSNRLPVIKIIETYFRDYQIFLLTHDLEWFAILSQRFDCPSNPASSNWKLMELFCTKPHHRNDSVEYEMPILAEKKDYLSKAQEYLALNDYKAAAIYLRTAFERILKTHCDKKGIAVTYREKAQRLTSEDFWKVVKVSLQPELVKKVEEARSLIMNPLSHARIVSIYHGEVKEAIEVISDLQQALAQL